MTGVAVLLILLVLVLVNMGLGGLSSQLTGDPIIPPPRPRRRRPF